MKKVKSDKSLLFPRQGKSILKMKKLTYLANWQSSQSLTSP